MCIIFSKIADTVGVSRTTVMNALKRACEGGVIDCSFEKIVQLRLENNPVRIGNHKKKVICNETGEVFIGYRDANIKYNASLADYFYTNGKRGFGYLDDGTKLSWSRL